MLRLLRLLRLGRPGGHQAREERSGKMRSERKEEKLHVLACYFKKWNPAFEEGSVRVKNKTISDVFSRAVSITRVVFQLIAEISLNFRLHFPFSTLESAQSRLLPESRLESSQSILMPNVFHKLLFFFLMNVVERRAPSGKCFLGL